MMMGLPQDVVFLGGLIMLATVVAFQMSPLIIALCISGALIVTPFLRRLFVKEPNIQAILPRALSYKAFLSTPGQGARVRVSGQGGEAREGG